MFAPKSLLTLSLTLGFGLLCQQAPLAAERPEPPRVVAPNWSIELVLAEPDLVTPVACTFDSRGRLLVIESHTHFPPEDYEGPAADRILALSDSDGDGTLDQRETFDHGTVATMGLATLDDGWVAVATRSEVWRIRDRDGDGQADQRERLAVLKTDAEYPHNGLAGLAVGPDGMLYVGQGENFGEEYEFVAADGSKQVGGGEGGNLFRLSPDGADLRRVATGFWNPFGICFDHAGRLWAVGNDPDAMPPCRLMHVVQSGDYGFQFRFGRGGTHPLQSWMGHLPGTLPPTAGTGEAPCAVMPCGDRLWVTSWGDNRVEAYRLRPDGGSWTSQTETIVQGDSQFRPVGMTTAPDGSVYITDWVKRDYEVHRTGRLWRLVPDDASAVAGALPELSPRERRAAEIRAEHDVQTLLTQLATPDRYQAQAAIAALSQRQDLERWSLGDCPTAAAKTGLLAAWRFRQLDQPESLPHDRQDALIRGGLASAAPEPLMLAIRWAAERQSVELLPQIEQVLERPDISPELFQVAVAAVSYLKQGTAKRGVRDPAQEQLLYELAAESAREDKIRALAVQMIPADAAKPSDAEAVDWVTASQSVFLQRELVLLLDERNTESAHQALAQLAAETALPGTIRADAVASLADRKSRYREAMESLLEENPPAELRREARRVLRGAEAVKREAAPPAAEDLAAWMKRVGSGGDPAAGRRVFRRAACVTCHQHSGRGATTGPDLTTLAGQSRQRILKSILQPSAEIGPLYVPWKILTVDGEVLVGLKNARPGPNRSLSFQAADGSDFFVGLDEVEYHSLSDVSIMPAGLEKTMRVDELRDLLAFLEAVEDTGAASVSSPR